MARHKLTAEQTKLCKGCRHGKAAHKGTCKMKYCNCKGFKG